ncbi:SUPPRESSOR OF npr1-1 CONSTITUTIVE 1 protein [Nymphaea thermarum]|nr:SUPPRESSOR OF npr1-1 CONSTITUTIVE 1 protein [Nymphaea thermarum]
MWKDCNFFPIIGIKVLLHKSLIKIAGREDEFEMHDQIRDMGRQIVLQDRSPGLRTRLWNNDDIFDVLQHQTGTRNIEGVVFDLKEGDKMCLNSKEFTTMPELRLLNVSYVNLEGDYQHLPRTLKWLEWRECPLDSLPYDFYLEKVVVLDLSYGMITKVWEQERATTKAFDKLKVLDLNWCENLTTAPDFSSMQYVVKLVFDMCCELTQLDDSIGLLKSLRYLSMRACSKLKNLPNNICQLRSLEILDITRCYKISVLPEQLGDLESLSRLIIDETRIIALPDSVSLMKKLVVLSVEGCKLLRGLPEWIGRVESLRELKLQESCIVGIPESIGSLTNLLTLDATACRSLRTLPDSVGNAKALRHLHLSGTAIQELPDSIVSLAKLEKLSVHGCPNLKALTSSIGLLKNLEMLSLHRLSIKELPENIGSLTKLRKLILASNPELAILPSSFFLLTSLEDLNAAECNWLEGIDGKDFGKLSSLRELHLNSSNFRSLPSTLYSLSQLTLLNLHECKRLQFLPKLPRSLLSLALTDCIALESISDLSNLSSLAILDLDGCLMLYDVPGLENLESLEKLSLKHCSRLSDTLRNRLKVANFERLSQFSISECLRLGDFADSRLSFVIPKMSRSRKVQLNLKGCFDSGKEMSVDIEVTAGKHTVYRSIGQHVLQLDQYCQITFNEDDEIHEHMRGGYVVVHIAREGLGQGNISATME